MPLVNTGSLLNLRHINPSAELKATRPDLSVPPSALNLWSLSIPFLVSRKGEKLCVTGAELARMILLSGYFSLK